MDFSAFPTTLAGFQKAVSSVCDTINQTQDQWIFAMADDDTLKAASAKAGGPKMVDTDLALGVTRKPKTTNEVAALQICTFYLAYSTWEGRVVFLDYFESQKGDGDDDDIADRITWTRLLARVARALQCRRLVWRHRHDMPLFGNVAAEKLDGWLTLYWKLDEMQSYAPYDRKNNLSTSSSSSLLSLQEAFAVALEQQERHETFRLRLATADDVDTIDRLVLGLAVFEKEPESYILSKEQLSHDGFSGRPFYYCILVDAYPTEPEHEPHTCAMAFCYIGYDIAQGRFLYLEDLFFEEEYRGKGGGKLVMSTLATVAQSLDCTKVVWQALDWNTPAITFYNKLGAYVQEGLITSRFAGKALEQIADQPLFDK